jgi:hypothetical protein
MPKHRHYSLVRVISLCKKGGSWVGGLPARHGRGSDRVGNALSALEGGDAHHVRIALGRLVGVLEADAFVAVVPRSDAGEKPGGTLVRYLIAGSVALTGRRAQCPFLG